MAEPPDLDALARRYLDLWQDQMTAMAGDPTLAAALGRLFETAAAAMPMNWFGAWLQAMQQAMRAGAASGDDGGGGTRAKAGAAAAAAAPVDGGRDLARLRRRVAALEARLARLEAGRLESGRLESGKPPAKRPVRRAPAKPRRR
jgi:hypothetical protein